MYIAVRMHYIFQMNFLCLIFLSFFSTSILAETYIAPAYLLEKISQRDLQSLIAFSGQCSTQSIERIDYSNDSPPAEILLHL